MKLDNKIATSLTMPAGMTDHIAWDEDLSGFGLRLRRSGDKVLRSWIAQYRSKGRTRRMTIAVVGTVSAAEGRKAAQKILSAVALGGDPQGDKAAARFRATRSLRAVVESYLAAKRAVLRPSTHQANARYLTGSYFKPLHAVAVTDIARADVAARLSAIQTASGSITALRARTALSSLFSWALGEGLAEHNPVIGTNRPASSQPRERVLTDAELTAIWTACRDDDYGRIIRLLILTAARRFEVGGMAWSELDLDTGKWSLPKERTKNNRAHTLYLPPLALRIIESVPQLVGRDYLFGERAAGFTMWNLGKRDLDARVQLKKWVVHDLRRGAATSMANLGVQPHVIETILNHQSGHRAGVAGVYNRSPYEREVRAALALWSEHVHTLVTGGERKVVRIDFGA